MVLEYCLIIIATVLFSVQFLFTKKYQLCLGTGAEASFFHKAISPITFGLILLIYSGFRIEITWYALVLALCGVGVSVGLAILGLKALGMGTISNYSLYLLSGGMIIPVVYGAIMGEPFGLWKIISIICVVLAIAVKFDFKEKTDFKTYLLLFAIFILNGLSGVISSMHQKDVFGLGLSVSAHSFTMLKLFIGSLVGIIVFAIIAIKKRKELKIQPFLKAIPWSIAEGVCNGVANFLLLLALLKIDASMQYPIVTGGSIFLSAILPFIIYKEKPDLRGWIAVAFAITGTVVMIF
ncbi:MAG: hypothetical protein J6C23_02115 [Clostridia bacterium]|nr:hypothetical protein [Clostridia bacterium]